MTSKLFIAVAAIVLFSGLVVVQKPLNGKIRQMEVVPIVDAIGPESVAFDPLGDGPYVGVSDGRILKWQENEHRWIGFGTTYQNREGCLGQQEHETREHICGRPLGICFSEATGELYIADAYMGLLKLGPGGGSATPIATQAEAVPFRFTNGLDINQSDGSIYFTDSSSVYQRRNYISVIQSWDRTGRLMKYEQENQQVTVLLTNLFSKWSGIKPRRQLPCLFRHHKMSNPKVLANNTEGWKSGNFGTTPGIPRQHQKKPERRIVGGITFTKNQDCVMDPLVSESGQGSDLVAAC